jgi:hypothetical protein
MEYLEDLSQLTEYSKPCFTKDGRLESGTGNAYLRTAANWANPISTRLGFEAETQRSIKPLTEYVNKIDRFFQSDEFERLSKDDYALLAYNTRSAAQGLGRLYTGYQADQQKSSIVQNAIRALEEHYPVIQRKIEYLEVDDKFALANQLFDSMVDVREREKTQVLTKQNRTLIKENQLLRDRVRILESELIHDSPALRTMRGLSSALSAFEQSPSPAAEKVRRQSF